MPIATLIQPHEKDLGGGFVVRRSLPAVAARSVGPFIFFDHFGPVTHRPSDNFDVRPHPHIGLATVTYLFEGAIMHRDTLGSVQRIEPGAINWMTAGKGIAHSERTPDDLRAAPYAVHGLQLWMALPLEYEECEPTFSHTPAAAIPVFNEALFSVRVLVGSAFGLTSPVATTTETLYLDFSAKASATITLPEVSIERGLYLISGTLEINGETVTPLQFVVLDAKTTTITAAAAARFVLVGGAPVDAHRHIWWNFVSSRRERIEQAKQDWVAQRFGAIAGETEFIPLPEQ